MKENFLLLLENLRKGKIKSFQVTSESFPSFYKIWNNYNFQSGIEGVAKKKGKIIYKRKQK